MEILFNQIRISKGITLIELAKRTGIIKSTLNNYENGITSTDLFDSEHK